MFQIAIRKAFLNLSKVSIFLSLILRSSLSDSSFTDTIFILSWGKTQLLNWSHWHPGREQDCPRRCLCWALDVCIGLLCHSLEVSQRENSDGYLMQFKSLSAANSHHLLRPFGDPEYQADGKRHSPL